MGGSEGATISRGDCFQLKSRARVLNALDYGGDIEVSIVVGSLINEEVLGDTCTCIVHIDHMLSRSVIHDKALAGTVDLIVRYLHVERQ